MGVGCALGVADGQVKAFAGQGAQAVRQIQLDAHLRVSLEELRQQRHELLAGQRDGRGQANQATGLGRQVAHLREAVFDLLEGGAGVIDQLLPGLGQAHAAGGALHQGDLGGTLELGDALAHGGLAHAQTGGCGGEAALLGQHAQPVQVTPQRGDFLLIHPSIVH